MKCNQSRPGFELVSPCPFPTTITITPRAHPLFLPTPPLVQDMTQGQFFNRGLTGLNSEFSFSLTSCLTKAEEPSLPYYLLIARVRIIVFIPFPRVLCEMQSVSSRFWTGVVVPISCDDNYYTTVYTFTLVLILILDPLGYGAVHCSPLSSHRNSAPVASYSTAGIFF